MASTPSAKQTYACLEIPMPSCMRDFVTHSSTPPPRPGGAYVDSLIANFGNVHGKAMEEVEKCRLLADGPDDIVILLERPATDHDYSAPLAEFVSCSETLRAVDELIRFATRAQRNIQNVSVVDVFSLKPEGANAPSDDECHDLAKEILLAKKPKVIIGCTTKIRQSHWLYCLNGKVTGVPCTKYIDLGINEHSALFVRSFHPGYCVNRVDWCVESRIKLVYDFVFAFQATTRPVEHPSWLSSISSLRAKQWVSPYQSCFPTLIPPVGHTNDLAEATILSTYSLTSGASTGFRAGIPSSSKRERKDCTILLWSKRSSTSFGHYQQCRGKSRLL